MFQNRPWAKPWVVFLVAAGLMGGLIAASDFVEHQPVTTVILVHHAEKNIEPDNPNSALSQAGEEWAQTLVRMLGETGFPVSMLHSTPHAIDGGSACWLRRLPCGKPPAFRE